MTKTISPQKGPQTKFLTTDADIALYGGSAGGGKSFALLLEGMRHIHKKGFVGVVFRRDSTQLRDGGLWTESQELYSMIGCKGSDVSMSWTSSNGGLLKFSHMQYEKDRLSHQGKQYSLIGFDELTHFTEEQFFYLLSRNRSSVCKPYVRATTNPDADSWVAPFIDWWIDAEGYPIKDRSGIVRYFYRSEGVINWADTAGELIKKFEAPIRSLYEKSEWEKGFDDFAKNMIKSFTFISSSIFDNKILLKDNPEYLASLQSQNKVERERLLNGNWRVRASAGMYFKKFYFDVVPAAPVNIKKIVRAWDLAATEPTSSNPSPDATAGVIMGMCSDNYVYILGLEHDRCTPSKVKKLIKNTAENDKSFNSNTQIVLPQDPGQAGKSQADDFGRLLHGFKFKTTRPTGDKVTRASAFSSQCEAGNVRIVSGEWNKILLDELEGFPDAKHDDIVDACADAYNELATQKKKVKIF